MKIEEISSLNFKEYASLIANYKTFGEEEKDFSRYTESQIKQMKLAKKQKDSSVKTYLNLNFTCDLSDLKFDNFDYIFNLYNHYKKYGNLPFSGTITEQPNKIIEIFNILSALQNEEILKEQKKQEQIQKSMNKRKT